MAFKLKNQAVELAVTNGADDYGIKVVSSADNHAGGKHWFSFFGTKPGGDRPTFDVFLDVEGLRSLRDGLTALLAVTK